MRYVSLSLFLVLAGAVQTQLAHAQEIAERPRGPGSVSGRVVSAADEQPLASASIAVLRMADSVLVAGRIADRNGGFRVDGLPTGSYLLRVEGPGWAPHLHDAIALTADAPAAELGTIRISPAAVQLGGVVGQGRRSPVTLAADRVIYNIREMPVVAGGTATDALRTIPDLQVDAEDNISARGAAPVMYLNGRPAPMQGEALTIYLRSLPAERIDRIEYIANPSARFEAEGQGGVVNIVLRQDAGLGLSGTLTGTVATQQTVGSSARINYQAGRVTIFGGGSLGVRGGGGSTFDLRENRVVSPRSFIQQSTDTHSDAVSAGVDVTAELKLGLQVTFWTTGRANLNDSNIGRATQVLELDAGELPTSRFDRLNYIDFRNQQLHAAVGLRRVIEPLRNEVSAEARYTRLDISADNDLTRQPLTLDGAPANTGLILTDVNGRHDEDIFSLQADLSRPLTSAMRLEAGYRGLFRYSVDSEWMHWYSGTVRANPLDSRFERFGYDQAFNAGYVTIDRTIGKLGIQLGVRGETARTRLTLSEPEESFANDYDALYPNLNLAYEIARGRQLRFSYSRRIDRPGTGLLNPINTAPTDPFNRVVGNPRLNPSFTHSFSLDAGWTGSRGTLRVSPFYYHRLGVWEQIRIVDAAGVSSVRPENTSSVDHYGLQLSASTQQAGPFSGSTSLYTFRQARNVGSLSLGRSQVVTTWSANANVGVRLSPTASAQVTLFYVPSQALPQGTSASVFQSSVAMRKQLVRRAAVNLSVTDPLGVYRSDWTTEDVYHRQIGRARPHFRRATLSLNYDFGRTPQAGRRVVQDQAPPQTPSAPVDIR